VPASRLQVTAPGAVRHDRGLPAHPVLAVRAKVFGSAFLKCDGGPPVRTIFFVTCFSSLRCSCGRPSGRRGVLPALSHAPALGYDDSSQPALQYDALEREHPRNREHGQHSQVSSLRGSETTSGIRRPRRGLRRRCLELGATCRRRVGPGPSRMAQEIVPIRRPRVCAGRRPDRLSEVADISPLQSGRRAAGRVHTCR